MNLNPFHKSNQRKKQKREEVRAAYRQEVDDLIAKAEALEDPAEKVLALREVQGAIRGRISDVQAAIKGEVEDKKDNRTINGTTAVGGGFFIATLAHPLFLLAAFMCFTGMGVAFAGEFGLDDRNRKKLESEAAEYMTCMDDKYEEISEMMKKIVAENVQAISRSPSYKAIAEDPNLSAIFAKAAAECVVEQANAVADLKKQVAQNPAAKGNDHPKPGYGRLTDALNPPKP